jgi:hypothetical protein
MCDHALTLSTLLIVFPFPFPLEGAGSCFVGLGWTLVESAILTSNNTKCCSAACVNSSSDNSGLDGTFLGAKGAVHNVGGRVRDLTCDCVEPNPGPSVLRTLSR